MDTARKSETSRKDRRLDNDYIPIRRCWKSRGEESCKILGYYHHSLFARCKWEHHECIQQYSDDRAADLWFVTHRPIHRRSWRWQGGSRIKAVRAHQSSW